MFNAETPRHYEMVNLTSLIIVEMCHYPGEGQICAVKGGIRPLFRSLALWEGPEYSKRPSKYISLYKWIRSYYV